MFLEVWDGISPFMVFLSGLIISILTSRKFYSKDKRALLIYVWHTAFTFVYYLYVAKYTGDATMYFENALRNNYTLQPGTHFIIFLTSILTNYLFLSMLSCFLFFNILGSLGLIILDSILQNIVNDQKKLLGIIVSLVIFLPSISFWSTGIGKDPISFLAVVLALWSTLDLKKRIASMGVSILLLFLVRPHIAGIMIIALAISLFFDKKTNIVAKALLGFIAIGISSLLVPYALNYSGVSSSSADGIATYIESREDIYQNTDSGITLSELNFPMKLFTYMFRPLIFEARSITQIFSALDNLILLYLFIFGSYKLIKTRNITSQENRKLMWTYAIIAWVVLALTTGNLGIAVRQKIMILPFFLYLFISIMSKNKRFSGY